MIKIKELIKYFYPETNEIMQDNGMTENKELSQWEFVHKKIDDYYILIDEYYNKLKNDPTINFKIDSKEKFFIKQYNFLSKYKKGDELYFFNTPESYWNSLKGRRGFVIFRKNKIVDVIVNSMN